MIVGLAGKKQAGKSTAAEALLDAKFDLMSFASTLKLMARVLMRECGLTEDQLQRAIKNKEEVMPIIGVSFRHLCQTLGTEWGRQHIHPDLWVIAAKHRASQSYSGVVFDDVRFDNEAKMIRNQGGIIIHIIRDQAGEIDRHESEQGISYADGDFVVNNDGDVDQLIDRVFEIVGVGVCK